MYSHIETSNTAGSRRTGSICRVEIIETIDDAQRHHHRRRGAALVAGRRQDTQSLFRHSLSIQTSSSQHVNHCVFYLHCQSNSFTCNRYALAIGLATVHIDNPQWYLWLFVLFFGF